MRCAMRGKTNPFSIPMTPEQTPSTQPASAIPDKLERGRFRVVAATIALNIAVVGLLTMVTWSDWRTGLALNFIDNLILGGFAWRRHDRLLLKFMGYGLVVGIVELIADAWLVDFTGTLDYSIGGGPMLWRSPLWMPFAWQMVTVQFAVIGLRLMRWRIGAGLLLTGLLGAINIPYYEEMARLIQWWRYSNCRMISGTPYYIIFGEFGIAMSLAWCARNIAGRRPSSIMALGAAAGLSILVFYVVAFLVTDRIW